MAPLKHGIYPTNLIKGPCRFIVSEGKFFFNNKSVKMTGEFVYILSAYRHSPLKNTAP